MRIQSTVALVTGANRGIGREIVSALVAAGAAKVYAAARDVARLAETVAIAPDRVVPLALDVADRQAVAALATAVPDLRLLVNNAGVLDFGSALDMAPEAIERNFTVNFYGPLLTTRALAPVIAGNGGGAVVNIASVVALASMPALAGYNASKAALWSLSQSQRGSLAPLGIAVHTVFPGPVDTDMAAEITFPKTSPADVARAIVEGIESGRDDIFPDPMSASVYEAWRADHKAIERQFAAV
ncbi:SDR family NAD(P)-dependent oxidoreductase [Oharaeibacter diazotrophicus]|uniref:Short-subunit dehydrogenase n=1 Tax=Oharaeibacter diazotrophicus TaxID=1920512 RepID=A0A4R6RMM5_9HYPH|nr:SDR family NAD(P)-dependent oxidoreductase [Oharaeibacter diazotrophicus]TDP87287.1 short-subunit dehydrogenase [Oharaeibacter diazotrophicus]BBE70769.1 3-alpha-(or 20-beta)-hydroxysteroid dehydrogenase [Pleomorphomonas sp. SM30]GLS77517.1 short-chain dehydrogenase [Oharaeibacter diazotrophicus]